MNYINILVLSVLTCICDATEYLINICDKTEKQVDFNVTFELPYELRTDKYQDKSINLTFRGNIHKLNCSEESFIATWEKEEENNTDDSQTIPDLIISPDKYIRYKNQVYEENQYCLLSHNDTQVQFEVCKRTCGQNVPCIYKCCEPDEIMDIGKLGHRCHPSGKDKWEPVLYTDENTPLIFDAANPIKIKPFLHYRHPKYFQSNCMDLEIVTLQNIGQPLFRILANGNILGPSFKNEWKILKGERYCVDGSHNFSEGKDFINGNEDNTILYRCYEKDPELINLEEIKRSLDILYGIVLVICSCFLLATLIVYSILWEFHNIHVIIQLCYTFSLLWAYIFMATTRFTSALWTRKDVVSNSCRIIGICSHFFYLTTFTWLSVINVDIWLTFRKLKPTKDNKKRGLKKLLAYCVYAEGIPFVIVSVAVVLDSIYKDDTENNVILPQYGKKNCFLDLYFAQFYYLYLPIGIFLTVNLILFMLTVYSVYSLKHSLKFVISNSSKLDDPIESFKLFAKLFILMGIPWIFDVISWAATDDYYDAKWYWAITDIFIFCQSIALFYFFVIKKSICTALETKYPRFKEFKYHLSSRWTSNGINKFLSFPKRHCSARGDNSSTTTTVSTDL